jgi:hypothetical protein
MENERFLTDQQMRAIQLGADVHCKIEGAHGPVAVRRAWKRYGEIAAEADECLGPSFDDCLHRGHRVMARRARRVETERGLDPRQQGGIRPLGNADGAIPLHIGMTAQRADAGAGFSEIAAQ